MRSCPAVHVFAVILALLAAHPARAQGDRAGARESLAGVGALSVDATVEGPAQLTSSESLRGRTLIRAAEERLRDAGLPVTAPSESVPNLHIHLNMMQIENGLIAFSVELDLFQEVFLSGNRQKLRAVTWNESVVGLVSHDMTSIIAESVHDLVDQFVLDFRSVN